MKSSIAFLALAVSSVSAFAPSQSSKSATELSLTREEILATPNTLELGEIYDPLGLSELGGDETIAWFRHAEVKHGRVAMAAFVGWCATAGAGLRFPGELAHGLEFSAVPSKGLEAWDAVPGWGKAQMLLFAGLIEFHDELFYARRGTHYMKGGVPGKNMVPGLYDPFNLSKGKSEAQLARGRDVEIKNGRLAMVGIAGMYFANVIDGSVPLQPVC
mmetsp:Transcript_16674/g.34349  ORF Transcript_16674/g.34349 Transcript_16674/m.34349 type:complete len:216 (+) Transcript_16674:257-904(+)|eukprot:CAMPEP_0201124610 /NCGR_PEP_ID=MMETSP0850-20130426/15926_1 /ASSEMBLY_ACC=CAM_ASM_000622 /TAXON_ID=183588 /ORGANISM="Pseudo-nitzschia fraudulenta, Strain WWA7" /LENGTH=215 /DNA_ID=CAMNT_0047392143 /DNA_START=110 /DNA_END=757 /DNA_ORIENTATION=+